MRTSNLLRVASCGSPINWKQLVVLKSGEESEVWEGLLSSEIALDSWVSRWFVQTLKKLYHHVLTWNSLENSLKCGLNIFITLILVIGNEMFSEGSIDPIEEMADGRWSALAWKESQTACCLAGSVLGFGGAERSKT